MDDGWWFSGQAHGLHHERSCMHVATPGEQHSTGGMNRTGGDWGGGLACMMSLDKLEHGNVAIVHTFSKR